MSDKYDRQGKPLGLMEWARLCEKSEYRSIGFTDIDGVTHGDRFLRRPIRISTVWLGLDHRLGGEGPPLIFETMVFAGGDAGGEELECERYSTEEDARSGHDALVRKWRAAYAEGNAHEVRPQGLPVGGSSGCASPLRAGGKEEA